MLPPRTSAPQPEGMAAQGGRHDPMLRSRNVHHLPADKGAICIPRVRRHAHGGQHHGLECFGSMDGVQLDFAANGNRNVYLEAAGRRWKEAKMAGETQTGYASCKVQDEGPSLFLTRRDLDGRTLRGARMSRLPDNGQEDDRRAPGRSPTAGQTQVAAVGVQRGHLRKVRTPSVGNFQHGRALRAGTHAPARGGGNHAASFPFWQRPADPSCVYKPDSAAGFMDVV